MIYQSTFRDRSPGMRSCTYSLTFHKTLSIKGKLSMRRQRYLLSTIYRLLTDAEGCIITSVNS